MTGDARRYRKGPGALRQGGCNTLPGKLRLKQQIRSYRLEQFGEDLTIILILLHSPRRCQTSPARRRRGDKPKELWWLGDQSQFERARSCPPLKTPPCCTHLSTIYQGHLTSVHNKYVSRMGISMNEPRPKDHPPKRLRQRRQQPLPEDLSGSIQGSRAQNPEDRGLLREMLRHAARLESNGRWPPNTSDTLAGAVAAKRQKLDWLHI